MNDKIESYFYSSEKNKEIKLSFNSEEINNETLKLSFNNLTQTTIECKKINYLIIYYK